MVIVTVYISLQPASPLYLNSHAIWGHTCHPAEVTFRLYANEIKLILDFATKEGCKAELTY